jgi:hypothetical protein
LIEKNNILKDKTAMNSEKNLRLNKLGQKELSFLLFFLIGLTFPYVIFSISLKTANLFLWEVAARVLLLFFTPISVVVFGLIGENLLSVKIFLKRFLYHITLLLGGVYLLCSFIEAEINISKWKVVSEPSENPLNLVILFSVCIFTGLILATIINKDLEYVEKKLKEKSKEMYIKKLKGF